MCCCCDVKSKFSAFYVGLHWFSHSQIFGTNRVHLTCMIHSVPEKKQPLICLVITSESVNQFSKFFHRQIPKKTDWVAMMAVSTSLELCCYTTLWNSKIHNNHQTITRTGKINLFYTKLGQVNKVQNVLISMWTNAVMCRVNVQNVLQQLQYRLSDACAIPWSHYQSVPGPDGPIPPRQAGAALPRLWSSSACTHTLVGSPTPHSWWGSDTDCSVATEKAESGLRALRSRLLHEQCSKLPVAYSFNSTQRAVLFGNTLSIFCCSIEILLS